ncbi:hypothetical protein [Pseudovibrio sp. Tun.PSC04-5.I4]|uniref:hypothetical protein n=1 Tax=Pseudovibrio sp. Tun.PSC04-5.I4 TaxID=1798213 RepID=UPI0008883CBA|nr:hypothetical protein [Pseudovibrio sp. Tun.PSC04-5.I4]SDR08093.1 hypothetical protein SAMN04515695_2653 [Pseudovibrio sp. Tun.PSC04-5.I4]
MARGRKQYRDDRQTDMFAANGQPAQALFPVHTPRTDIECMDFSYRLKRDMSQALKECSLSREDVSARMGAILGQPKFSKAMLDKYTSESSETHQISLLRFKAFVKATGCNWLWQRVVEDDGLTLMEGEEARLAQVGFVEQQIREKQQFLKDLKSKPVRVRGRR